MNTLTYKDDRSAALRAGSSNVKGTTTWTYEPNRQIVTQIANVWGTGPGTTIS